MPHTKGDLGEPETSISRRFETPPWRHRRHAVRWLADGTRAKNAEPPWLHTSRSVLMINVISNFSSWLSATDCCKSSLTLCEFEFSTRLLIELNFQGEKLLPSRFYITFCSADFLNSITVISIFGHYFLLLSAFSRRDCCFSWGFPLYIHFCKHLWPRFPDLIDWATSKGHFLS